MLCVCAVLGAGAFFFISQSGKQKKTAVGADQKSANEFVNVKDIRGRYLYTADGHILCFIRLNPISIDLYSKGEKQTLMKMLTAELSAVQYPFKFLAVSRPIDISPLIGELSGLMSDAGTVQKELLKQELSVMNGYAGSGEIVERQFYLSIWGDYGEGCERDMLSRARELCAVFENGGLTCEITGEEEMTRLIGLINNPSRAHLEDTDFSEDIPVVSC
jgi:hypothetical protein